jgi:DNA-binding transcriptional LysR family regulator
MSRRLPPLNALRAFEAAARHNSFTSAAAELRVSHAAISRHVRALEARLGVRLFNRVKRGVALTAAGADYLRTVSTAFDAIAEATDELAHPGRVKIRVSVHPAFAARWLIHRLDGFRRANPDCDVVLDATPRLVDLGRDEADLSIRNGEGGWPGLACDLLARSRLYPVGAPALLGRRRARLTPAELTSYPLLHDENGGDGWRRWFAVAGIADAEIEGGSYLLETNLAIDAAIAGQGVALVDDFLVTADLAAGRLVRFSEIPLAASDGDFHLLGLESSLRRGPIGAFRSWLLSESDPLRRPR